MAGEAKVLTLFLSEPDAEHVADCVRRMCADEGRPVRVEITEGHEMGAGMVLPDRPSLDDLIAAADAVERVSHDGVAGADRVTVFYVVMRLKILALQLLNDRLSEHGRGTRRAGGDRGV